MENPQKKYIDLCNKIIRYDELYYIRNSPEISDYEYDLLMKELKDLEEKHPEIKVPWSPTQRIGAPLPEGSKFPKIKI